MASSFSSSSFCRSITAMIMFLSSSVRWLRSGSSCIGGGTVGGRGPRGPTEEDIFFPPLPYTFYLCTANQASLSSAPFTLESSEQQQPAALWQQRRRRRPSLSWLLASTPTRLLLLLAPFVSAASESSGAAVPPPAAHPPGGGRAGRGCRGAEAPDRRWRAACGSGGGRCAPRAGREGRVLPPPRCSAAASLALGGGREFGAGEAESEARRRCLTGGSAACPCRCHCPCRGPGLAAPLPAAPLARPAAARSRRWSRHRRLPHALLDVSAPQVEAASSPESRQRCRLSRGRGSRGTGSGGGAALRAGCGLAAGCRGAPGSGAAAGPSGVSRARPSPWDSSCSPPAFSQRCHHSTVLCSGSHTSAFSSYASYTQSVSCSTHTSHGVGKCS